MYIFKGANDLTCPCRALNNLKTLQSPVFLSTAEDGTVQQGCGAIPLDRPLLLVSNHQTYALDIGPLIEGLLRQTGLLPRGLTHPAVFQASCVTMSVPADRLTYTACLMFTACVICTACALSCSTCLLDLASSCKCCSSISAGYYTNHRCLCSQTHNPAILHT